MVDTSAGVESAAEELGRLEVQSSSTVPEDVQLELRLLKMFLCCLTKCEAAVMNINLTSVIANTETILKEAGFLTVTSDNKGEDLDFVAPSLLEKVYHFEPEIRKICAVLLDSSLKSVSCSTDEILEFTDGLVGNLKDLVNLKADIVFPVKNQVRVLEEKLSFLRDLVDFTAKRCIEPQKLEDLLEYVKDWALKAACLSLLCLLDGNDEKMVQILETMISDLLQKIKPYTPEVAGLFVGVLKASKSSRSDKLLAGQIVAGIVDFLLESLVDPLKDYVEILREGLIFMITFFMDPSEEAAMDADDSLFTQFNILIDEVLSFISSLHKDELKVDISMESKMDVKSGLSNFQDKFKRLKEEVEKLYVQVPNSSDLNFSMTNGMGFIDFFLENLKEMLKRNPDRIVFAKHQVAIVQEELLALEPFLKDIMELQKEREDLKDLWRRIINLVLLAEHVITSCLIIDYPIWYDMLRLSNVIRAIELIENEVKKYSGQMCNTRIPSSETNYSQKQANTSSLDDVVVGWKDESMTIIGKLTRGIAQLDIVSIVGMPGLGKTTLAKKVYNDPSVKYYFNRRAWCCVSQEYKRRELLFDILSDITGVDARESDSDRSDDDLAEKLRKCLKGRKYLIVLDDIWNIEAWHSIQGSFPNDNNGSRIMFTSRIHNLVSQAKLNCSPHPLRPLSDDESWELLQEKLFHKDGGLSDDLLKIAKNIAKNCKGLPLAVVLVAGVLARTSKKVDSWKQIEDSTGSQVASEGCMDVLELSYKHLPDSLKSCFLYFGAFPEDRVVRARKLTDLWIAEGLIPRTDKKSLHEVAEDYLSDLIGRSLVILAERSSNGGIKACRVHDLLHDLCLAKIREDNFLDWVRDNDVSYSSSSLKRYDNYRLCINAEWTKFVDTVPTGPLVHSLILLRDYQAWQSFPCPSFLFKNFKLLNVLDLECILIGCPFPEELTLMVHLRYLAIWCHATVIPTSIANLWNLETLIVKGSAADIPLPSTIWQMKSLRHVHIPSMCLTGLEDHEYSQLERMDIFSTPHLNSGNETKEFLRRVPGLRKLKCIFLERPFNYEPYKFPELSCLVDLESLKVFSYGLVFYGENRDQFPAFDFPNSLRRLTLGRFTLPWRAISVLGQLPNLEVLKLRSRAFSGKRWDTEEDEFLNLKLLELWQLNIEEWTVPDEPFPNLERLIVKDCYNLTGIPSTLGYIPTLKKIEMRWCFQASSSAREILEEQREMGNDDLEVIVFD